MKRERKQEKRVNELEKMLQCEDPSDSVEKRDLQASRSSHFRRAKASRAAADDGELGVALQIAEVMGMVGGLN